MKAKILEVNQRPSRWGGIFYYVKLQGIDDNEIYRTYVYKSMRNYHRWKKVFKKGTVLSHLQILKGKIINADSRFQKIGE